MNGISGYVSDIISRYPPSELPGFLWKCYIDYLWNYEPNSWVAKIAYTCRFMAFIIAFPFLVLTLLDVASYVIARTLGVIDHVKASTTDKVTLSGVPMPTIVIQEATSSVRIGHEFPDSEQRNTKEDEGSEGRPVDFATENLPSLDISEPHAFFVSEENNLKLSGVGVFSPAASQPPSPTITRRQLPLEGTGNSREGILNDSLSFRKRRERDATSSTSED